MAFKFSCRIATVIFTATFTVSAIAYAAGDTSFPYGRDLLLDVSPMKGSKRVPIVEIDEDGTAIIDLWCDRVEGRAQVSGDTITIVPTSRAGANCPADRAQADDEMIDVLQQITGWRRTGDGVALIGPRTLNFRLPTN